MKKRLPKPPPGVGVRITGDCYSIGIPLTKEQAQRWSVKTLWWIRRATDRRSLGSAIREREEAMARLEDGLHPFPSSIRAPEPELRTLSEVVDRHLSQRVPGREGTRLLMERYAANIRLSPVLRDLDPRLLTRDHLLRFCEDRKAETTQRDGTTKKGRRAGIMTVKLDVGFLKAALRAAKILTDPDLWKGLMPRNPKKFKRLSNADLLRMIEALPDHYGPYARFLRVVGMRSSEARTLEWSQVDRATTEATLSLTKNGDDRVVRLSPPAQAILLELRPTAFGRVGRIFPGVEVSSFGKAWSRARKRIGLTQRPHDLRGSWACEFHEKGAGIHEVMAQGGWRDIKTLVGRYLETSVEHTDEVLRRMAAL